MDKEHIDPEQLEKFRHRILGSLPVEVLRDGSYQTFFDTCAKLLLDHPWIFTRVMQRFARIIPSARRGAPSQEDLSCRPDT